MNVEVKRAFVLADWMKAARRCESGEEFVALLEVETARLAKLAEPELDSIIARDPMRLRRFETLRWKQGDVTLGDCYVYPKMGGRPWAVGQVRDVAAKFTRMEPSMSRMWQMKLFSSLFIRLPLIIVMNGSLHEIDDGSHRAIAMFLSGMKDARAYIGASQPVQ